MITALILSRLRIVAGIIPPAVWRALCVALALLATHWGAYVLGGRDARAQADFDAAAARLQADLDAAERYRDTIERMNDAGLDTSDPGAVLDRLRDLAK